MKRVAACHQALKKKKIYLQKTELNFVLKWQKNFAGTLQQGDKIWFGNEKEKQPYCH
jgi:hypothetical protein